MLTFIDLFAGIGGIRLAFEDAGCHCVFSSEWDRFSQKTYEANFGEKPFGDITKIQSSRYPTLIYLLLGSLVSLSLWPGCIRGFLILVVLSSLK